MFCDNCKKVFDENKILEEKEPARTCEVFDSHAKIIKYLKDCEVPLKDDHAILETFNHLFNCCGNPDIWWLER